MHKFGSITVRASALHTPLVRWIVPTNVDHRPVKINSRTWRVFCQKSLVIAPKTTKTVKLPIGVELSDGVIMTSLCQSLKEKRCSLQNELTLDSVNNVIVIIQNNSDNEAVNILEGTPICHVSYML